MSTEDVLRPVLVVSGAVVLTLAVGALVDFLLRRADARHPETPLWGALRRCRVPLRLVVLSALLLGSYEETGLTEGHEEFVGRALTLALLAGVGWLVNRIVNVIVEVTYSRYANRSRDAARLRRVRTQLTLVERVTGFVVIVVTVAAMLLTFPQMRAVGTSMLASAGIIGIIAGIAAQSTLGNLFAGLQIAFGDLVRLGDTVVVEGEWGTVEEITLTFLTVKTWDERRYTVPVSYFTSRPFENWSRGGAEITGTVFFHLDHHTPVQALRERLGELVEASDHWDGRNWNLVVTDTTPSTIEVRALVTARDADAVWSLRCEVREGLVAWLAEKHPYALPRIMTAHAPTADGLRPRSAGLG
ncbi:mechanosensitive ion channel domain-containing protein [Streptomyces sp. NPDC051940]|uniref:mechanosensitive ion channel family protein n=1 Tax=Streptomyces sp. NPDC051940 TaxID=3155675 RepID=UPI00341D09C3